MEDDAKRKVKRRTVPVLIYVDPKDWPEFQRKAGPRGVSKRIRAMVKADLKRG